MPYRSQAQAGFFHTHKKQLERQGVNVGEWDSASKGMSLPKHAKSSSVTRMAKPRVTGPIQHPGSLRKAATQTKKLK